MGSRKYLCEFRDQCPEFNKMNIICRDKPWICGYWKIHFEDLQKRVKPITDKNYLTNLISRPLSSEDF